MKMLRTVLVLPAMFLLVMLLSGCPVNPVREAETFEQKAYALYGTYVIFQGKAAELVQDSTIPERVKVALRDADKVSYPVAERLVDAAGEVSRIRDIINDCSDLEMPELDPSCTPSNEQRLTNAITNLGTIYYSAQPVLLNLVSIVKGAKSP